MTKQKVLGYNILDLSCQDILKYIDKCIEKKGRLTLSYLNAYVVLLAKKNSIFREVISSLNLYTDGIGMFWAKQLLNKAGGYRTVATDFNSHLLKLAESKKYNVFFLGGSFHAAEILHEKLRYKYPLLNLGGILCRDVLLNSDLIERLNASKSDILFVGLGTPIQEEWIVQNGLQVNIPVQIAVGSWIDYLAETYKRAPRLMQKLGLEWLFRLIYDPRRLWRRYIIGIPQFIFLVLKEYFKKGKRDV